MALTILRQPGFGEQLGSAFGTGLSSGIQALADLKMRKLLSEQERAQEADALEAAGINPALAGLNPQIQQAIIGQMGMQQQAQQQQAEQKKIADMLAALEGGEEILGQEEALEEVASVQSSEPEVRKVSDTKAREESSIQKSLKKSPVIKSTKKLVKYENALRDPSLSGKAREEVRKRADKEEERLDKLRLEGFEKTEKTRSEITKKAQEGRELKESIDRMAELNESGNIDTPGYIGMLDKMGLGSFDSLLSADTQEFRKRSGAFLKGMKDIFGGNITQREMDTFLKTMPSLYQSPEGRRRILLTLGKVAQASQIKSEVMDNIIEANEGVPPLNLSSLVEKESKPLIDALAREVKRDIKDANKQLKVQESGVATGAKLAAGAGLGASGTGLKLGIPAAIGGAIGSVVPGIGTALGAGVGAGAGALGTYGGQILDLLGKMGG